MSFIPFYWSGKHCSVVDGLFCREREDRCRADALFCRAIKSHPKVTWAIFDLKWHSLNATSYISDKVWQLTKSSALMKKCCDWLRGLQNALIGWPILWQNAVIGCSHPHEDIANRRDQSGANYFGRDKERKKITLHNLTFSKLCHGGFCHGTCAIKGIPIQKQDCESPRNWTFRTMIGDWIFTVYWRFTILFPTNF